MWCGRRGGRYNEAGWEEREMEGERHGGHVRVREKREIRERGKEKR